ncbi:MAG: P-loop NTPase [Spirochaetaceae bacterium]|nr:P-loop NTPase [Spirochaetaceae bacterium]
MQIIPVASGKGGVGKSLFSANLAIALAQSDKKVVVVDLDLGASNLHLALGMQRNKHGIGTFLAGSSSFDDIVLETPYDGVRFIAGDSEMPGFAALKVYEKKKLVSNLLALDTDYLVLDLGAGTSLGILDFFLLSPQGVLITAPTVTAILDAYLFLKNIVFRMISQAFPKKSHGSAYLAALQTDVQSMQRLYIPTLLEELKKCDLKHATKLEAKLEHFKPRVVLNMVENPADADKVFKLRNSCKQYLNIDLEHLGVISKDSVQDIALASRLPVIVYKPDAIISQGIYRICEKILTSEDLHFEDMSGVDFEEYSDDSFNLANEEAETDYRSRISYLEDLIGSKTLSVQDLYEVVRSQHFEITSLKRENQLLKTKLKQAIEQGFIS